MVSGTSQKWFITWFITSSLFQPLHNIHRGVRMSQEQVWALNHPWKVIYVQKRAKKHDFEPFWDPLKKTYWFVFALSTLVPDMMSIWDFYTAKKGPDAAHWANKKWKKSKNHASGPLWPNIARIRKQVRSTWLPPEPKNRDKIAKNQIVQNRYYRCLFLL